MSEPYRIVVSPEASDDLQSLYAFIAQDSPGNADRMVDRILLAIETLKSFPHRTVVEHTSPRLRHPVRSLPVRPYVVYFRVVDEERIVRILTIRHGARRPPRRL